MKIIFLLIFLIVGCIASAQYNLQWYSTYDHPYGFSYYDEAIDLVEDNFGNVYVTGTSFGEGDDSRYDIATIKYNSSGDSEWVKRYHFFSSDIAVSIAKDNQSNIYVSGNSFDSIEDGFAMVLIKYDSQGNELWVKRYHDPLYDYNTVVDKMIMDSSGNMYLAGSAYNRYTGDGSTEIVKYTVNGIIEWIQKYNRGTYDFNKLNAIDIDNDGNIFVTGYTRDMNSSQNDYLTIKYSNNGTLQWVTRADVSNVDVGFSIKADNYGNVYVAGYSKTSDNIYDMKLLKYNSAGELQWIKSQTGRYDSNGSLPYPYPKMLVLDDNGNAYVNFMAHRSSYHNDIATAKYNTSGELKWLKLYNNNIGQYPSYEETADIKKDNSNNIYVTGTSRFDTSGNTFVILKYDTTGVLQKVVRNQNQFSNHFFPAAISVNNNGDVIATGSCTKAWQQSVTDYFTIKYSKDVGIQQVSSLIPAAFKLYQNYPNPFNPSTNIKYEIVSSSNVSLKIYDALGKEIATLVNQKQNAGTYEIKMYGSYLSSGVYFYKLVVSGANPLETKLFAGSVNSFSEIKKMILLR